MDPHVFRPIFYGLIMWAVTIYAFRKGGWEERAAAIGIVICSYASVLVASRNGSFEHFEVSVALVDLTLLIALQLIALRSNKFWPLWLTAIQGVTVLGHLVPLIPGAQAATSHNAVSLWSYPVLLIIAFGIRSQLVAAREVRL